MCTFACSNHIKTEQPECTKQHKPKTNKIKANNTNTPDVCINYKSKQSLLSIQNNGFVSQNGQCYLKYNHNAYARMGFDATKMRGYYGESINIGLVDLGLFKPDANTNIHIHFCNHTDFDATNTVSATHPKKIAMSIVDKKYGLAKDSTVHYYPVLKSNLSYTKKEDFYDVMNFVLTQKQNLSVIMYPNELAWNFLIQDKSLQKNINKIKHNKAVNVFSAGNHGQNLSKLIHANKLQTNFNHSLSLKNVDVSDKVIFVGSFDVEKNQLSTGSNYPGDIEELQNRFIVSVGNNLDLLVNTDKLSYSNKKLSSGTSYAISQISAAIAIIKSIDRSLTSVAAANIVLETANQNLPEYNQLCNTKHGKVNCGKLKYGRGLLDVETAVKVTLHRLNEKCN